MYRYVCKARISLPLRSAPSSSRLLPGRCRGLATSSAAAAATTQSSLPIIAVPSFQQQGYGRVASSSSCWILGAVGLAAAAAATAGSATVAACDEAHAPQIKAVAAAPVAEDKHKELEAFRPLPEEGFVRVDTLLETTHSQYLANNAVHDTLRGESLIEAYEVYFNETTRDIRCIVRFGNTLNGHQGIVHGGITALVFDNTFGWLFFTQGDVPAAFTANLSINYK